MKLQYNNLIFQGMTCLILSLILNSPSIHADSGTHGGVGSTQDAATAAAKTAADREKSNQSDANTLVNPNQSGVVVPETVVVPNNATTSTTSTTTTTTTTAPSPNALPANTTPQQGVKVVPQSNPNNGSSSN